MTDNIKKILLVEDDVMLYTMYKAKFEADGFTVFTAADGATGLEIAKQEKPDIIILDIILPGLDGFSVLEELKKSKETAGIPVIMLTNLGTIEDRDKGQKMGALDYLIKASLTPTQISEKVKQIFKIK